MRRSCDRPIAAALAAIVSVGLALCGCANGGGETTIPTTGASAVCTSSTAPGSVARPGGGSRVAWVRVIPVSTLPPAVIIGQVGVVVEADHYGSTDTIAIWAGNGLSQCVYATDHHSECSVVTLERRTADGWKPLAPCARASATRILGLEALRAIYATLAPPASGGQSASWPAGTYRVAFTYLLAADGTGQAIEVDSAEFVIA